MIVWYPCDLDRMPLPIASCMNYFMDRYLQHIALPCWIAGGAIHDYFMQGRPQKDVDLYVPNAETAAEVIKVLKEHEEFKGELIYETSTVSGYKTKRGRIEVIYRYFPDPDATIEQFDFTVCAAAISFPLRFCALDTFFIDLASRRLVINAMPAPLATLERLQRYIKKGFTMGNVSMLELARGIQKVDLNDPTKNRLLFYADGTLRKQI